MTVRALWVGIAIVGLILAALGCSEERETDGGPIPGGPMLATCEGCHTDSEMLIATAEPDTVVESEGEG